MKNHSIQLWQTLKQIQVAIDLGDAKLMDILQLTKRSFESCRATQSDLPATSVFRLGEYLGIGFKPIVTGNIDFVSLVNRFHKGQFTLPKRYQTAAMSKRRTSIYMLNYVTSVLGKVHRESILRNFQLCEGHFLDSDASINILFPIDLCEYLQRYRLIEDEDFVKMGRSSADVLKLKQLDDLSNSVKNIDEFYDGMCDLMPAHIEKNCLYRIEKSLPGGCLVSSHSNPEVRDSLNLLHVGNSAICLVRGGFGAAFPKIMGLPGANVKKVACVHQGDSECRYVYEYEEAASAFAKLRQPGASSQAFL
jgi:hypothetical protein